MADDSRYLLALEEGRRGFDRLSDDLTRLRDRTGQLVTFGALVASFLGGIATAKHGASSGWAWLGIAAFLLLLALWIAAHWPRDYIPGVDAGELVRWGDDPAINSDDMNRDLALYFAAARTTNAKVVKTVMHLYRAATLVFVTEVVLLMLDVRSR